jgi:hypothetical protein
MPLHEAPEGIRREAEGQRDQRDLAEGIVRELLERALAARGPPTVPERELQGEYADKTE